MISIIIPVYNAENFIEECLNSILNQTYRDIEVIAIDDGSIDASFDILKRAALNDSRLKVYSQKNAGVSVARNRGIKLAQGEYILFVDADDYLYKQDALNTIISSSKGIDMVFFGIQYENRSHKPMLSSGVYNSLSLPEIISKTIVSEEINSPCTKLYKRSVLKDNKLRFNENIKIGEDLLFNVEYMQYIDSIKYINEPLYFYRTSNEQSATKTFKVGKYENLVYVNRSIKKVFVSIYGKDIPNQINGALDYIVIKNIVSCMIDVVKNKDLSNQRQEIIKNMKKDNSIGLIKGMGVKFFSISLIYKIAPPNFISFIGYHLNERLK